jgi:hypothetical protein
MSGVIHDGWAVRKRTSGGRRSLFPWSGGDQLSIVDVDGAMAVCAYDQILAEWVYSHKARDSYSPRLYPDSDFTSRCS